MCLRELQRARWASSLLELLPCVRLRKYMNLYTRVELTIIHFLIPIFLFGRVPRSGPRYWYIIFPIPLRALCLPRRCSFVTSALFYLFLLCKNIYFLLPLLYNIYSLNCLISSLYFLFSFLSFFPLLFYLSSSFLSFFSILSFVVFLLSILSLLRILPFLSSILRILSFLSSVLSLPPRFHLKIRINDS